MSEIEMTSEAQVLNALQSDISGLNDIVLRGQIFRLALQVDNSTNATDDHSEIQHVCKDWQRLRTLGNLCLSTG